MEEQNERAKGRSKRETVIEESKPYILCIFANVLFAGYNIICKLALNQRHESVCACGLWKCYWNYSYWSSSTCFWKVFERFYYSYCCCFCPYFLLNFPITFLEVLTSFSQTSVHQSVFWFLIFSYYLFFQI